MSDGGWTIRQVVHHLPDGHPNCPRRACWKASTPDRLFFESLAPQDWTRRFFQPEGGALSIQDILPAFAWHSRHHTAHITELRKRMGCLGAE